jgi:hypothetical protein
MSLTVLSHNDLTACYRRVGINGKPVAMSLCETQKQLTGQARMKVKFVLTMDDVVVDNKQIDQLVMDWVSDVDQEEIMEVSHKWITTQNFLTNRMQGLSRVGESSLTIEPLEEQPDAEF